MPSEHEEQKTLFQWAAIRAKGRPELGLLLAIPNGGMRSKITAAKLKAEGVKSGVPDVCLPVRTEQYGSLWIELKRPGERGRPAGRVSPEQSRWIADLQIAGQCAAVCFGWEEARDVIEAYLWEPR